MSCIKILISFFLFLFLIFSCSDPEDDTLDEVVDCAGVPNGNTICGCMDSTAFNYNSSATYDDGSCQAHVDNGDYFLSFNGSNAYVDLGDILPQGSYTKAAWVKRVNGDSPANNIISGNAGHAFWGPQSQGSKLSAGHQSNFSIVQDSDALSEGEWTFVAVSFDASSGTMTLYKNSSQVDQAIGVPIHDESTVTYIGRYLNGNWWSGDIDEAAIWDKALDANEIVELGNFENNMDATLERGSYASSDNLVGYWKMNEGEGGLLSDASGNGNMGAINFAEWNTCDVCGCMDESACNYDPSATIDNRSCDYVDEPCEVCVDSEIVIDDYDMDGLCNDDDEDDDNDNVPDVDDLDPFNNRVCSDVDQDGCDDCSSGIFDTDNDGVDDDGDGICNQCGTDTTYSKVLPGTAGYDIIRSSNCSYVIAGSDGSTILLKIDEYGNEIWSRNYSEVPGSHWGKSVTKTSDDGYIIGAHQNIIIKTDSTGLLEWYYKLSYGYTYYVEEVIQTFAGDYIVVGGISGDPPSNGGHAQMGQAFILRMSEGGGVQWVKRYGISNTPDDGFWGVVQADDGGFVLAGNKLQDRNFEFYDHFWIMKVDGNGNEVWSHELGGNLWDEATSIVKLSDDSYILSGKKSLSSTNLNMFVVRVASNGTILWQNDHGGGNNDTGLSITLSEDESMVAVVGYTRSNSGNPFSYRVWGVDVSSGQILWSRVHGGNQDDKANGVVETYDNGFAIVGRSYSYGSPYVHWMVKTDQTGTLE